jgi:uncharacterized protein (DUF302 family)
MYKFLSLFLVPLFLFSASMNKHGIVTKESKSSVNETVNTLLAFGNKNGFSDFSIIDHQENVKESSNISIKETKLIIFKRPVMCSSLLQYDPAVGLDLPLRILVYMGEDNHVYIKYRDPKFLKNIYNLGDKKEAELMSEKLDNLTDIAAK